MKSKNEGRTVLETFPCRPRNDFIRVVDPRKWGDLGQYYDFTEEWSENKDDGPCASGWGVGERDGGDQTEVGTRKTDFDDLEMDCGELDDCADDSKLKAEGHPHDDEDESDDEDLLCDVDTDDDVDDVDVDDMDEDLSDSDAEVPIDYALYNKLIRRAKLIAKQRNQEAKPDQTTTKVERRPYCDVIREIQASGRKIILIVHSFPRDEERCQIAMYAVKEGEVNVTKPFKSLTMNAGILGLRITPDNRYVSYMSG
jgi:hypothetical protein